MLLLGLLLPIAAAVCYPFRHRISAAAAGQLGPPTDGIVPGPPPVPPTYRSTLDPFAASAMGLCGPGAVSTARIFALTALNDHGDTSLVVVPRPDATRLFGLDEDELLDDTTAGLFIPGNLDAALAYLETELIIRQNTGTVQARRLLLVADCEDESSRITKLVTRHPGGVCTILLGPWTGDHASIDDDGLVDATPALTAHLPTHLPAMSRTEARDRLYAAIRLHETEKKRPSRRRNGSRRS